MSGSLQKVFVTRLLFCVLLGGLQVVYAADVTGPATVKVVEKTETVKAISKSSVADNVGVKTDEASTKVEDKSADKTTKDEADKKAEDKTDSDTADDEDYFDDLPTADQDMGAASDTPLAEGETDSDAASEASDKLRSETAKPEKTKGVYIFAGLGYVATEYNNRYDFPRGSGGGRTNVNGAFAFGGDLGYQFNRYVGADIGYYSSLRTILSLKAVGATRIQWWALAASIKLQLPLNKRLWLYSKLGMGYQDYALVNNRSARSGFSAANNAVIRPVFTLGASFRLDRGLKLNVKYIHFMGGMNFNGAASPASQQVRFSNDPDLFLVGVCHLFDL